MLNYRGHASRNSFNDASYSYNFAPPNYLQLPLERTSVFVAGSFDVTDHHQVYAQGIYADYTVDTALAPTPLSSVFTPPTNPFIPDDLQVAARCPRNPWLALLADPPHDGNRRRARKATSMRSTSSSSA